MICRRDSKEKPNIPILYWLQVVFLGLTLPRCCTACKTHNEPIKGRSYLGSVVVEPHKQNVNRTLPRCM